MKVYRISFSIYGVGSTVDALVYIENKAPIISLCFHVPLYDKKANLIISALSCLNALDKFCCEVNQVKFTLVFDNFDYYRTILSSNHPASYYDVNLAVVQDDLLSRYLEQFGNGYTIYLGIPVV